MFKQILAIWFIFVKVVVELKQSTTTEVWYDTPSPSGKNVVPLTGGAHS